MDLSGAVTSEQRAVRQDTYDSADQIEDLIERGIPLRPGAVEGGRDGIRYGFDALHPQYRRVPWKDVNGKPAVRTARLPDADTDMNMDAFYRECLRAGLTDLGLSSQVSLSSRSPAHPNPNSVGGLTHPTTEVQPLEGTTARCKGFCLIMLHTKALLGPKAIENYCGFRSEIFLNNRDA